MRHLPSSGQHLRGKGGGQEPQAVQRAENLDLGDPGPAEVQAPIASPPARGRR
jgi:hypothetical protein